MSEKITDERLAHIKRRHANDTEEFSVMCEAQQSRAMMTRLLALEQRMLKYAPLTKPDASQFEAGIANATEMWRAQLELELGGATAVTKAAAERQFVPINLLREELSIKDLDALVERLCDLDSTLSRLGLPRMASAKDDLYRAQVAIVRLIAIMKGSQ